MPAAHATVVWLSTTPSSPAPCHPAAGWACCRCASGRESTTCSSTGAACRTLLRWRPPPAEKNWVRRRAAALPAPAAATRHSSQPRGRAASSARQQQQQRCRSGRSTSSSPWQQSRLLEGMQLPMARQPRAEPRLALAKRASLVLGCLVLGCLVQRTAVCRRGRLCALVPLPRRASRLGASAVPPMQTSQPQHSTARQLPPTTPAGAHLPSVPASGWEAWRVPWACWAGSAGGMVQAAAEAAVSCPPGSRHCELPGMEASPVLRLCSVSTSVQTCEFLHDSTACYRMCFCSPCLA